MVRTSGHGVPDSVLQKKETYVKLAESLQEMTKVARYDNLLGCSDMLVASVYDTKPVQLLSIVMESIEWKVKEKRVWNQQEKKKTKLWFLCLTMVVS